MPTKDLPEFIIYQPNEKEFHICLEVGKEFYRWCSYYPPTPDTRFARAVTRISNLPLKKIPRKGVFDSGTYTVTKSDTRESSEKKVADGINKKSFAFILNGKKLKGRFALKKTSAGTVLQKFKDKFAVEEDVLSGDLSRTIHTMIPDYDEKKVKLERPAKETKREAVQEQEVEEITADKKIGNTEYHFAYYTCDGQPDLWIVTNPGGEVLVLKNEKKQWRLMPPVNRLVLKRQKEFIQHATALDKLQNK